MRKANRSEVRVERLGLNVACPELGVPPAQVGASMIQSSAILGVKGPSLFDIAMCGLHNGTA